jgi:hypothetical protein
MWVTPSFPQRHGKGFDFALVANPRRRRLPERPLTGSTIGRNRSPAAVQVIEKKLNGARRLPDPKVVAQLDDSERSHFVTSFSSLQLLLGCT